jgi:hypothetical protein
MTRLSQRKTRLVIVSEATARYRGRERNVIVEAQSNGHTFMVRLAGTRARYEVSWRGLYDYAARVHAERVRDERRKKRSAHV